MRVVLERGDEFGELVKRRRMRDRDILDDRDLLMLSQQCQGRPLREIGRLFRVTKQLVSFRLRQLPEPVTAGMRRLVATKLAREGVVFISEQEMDGLKAIIRRERKKAHGRKPQQVA
jgi:hypothetical protein